MIEVEEVPRWRWRCRACRQVGELRPHPVIAERDAAGHDCPALTVAEVAP